jgi:hypothetical protein
LAASLKAVIRKTTIVTWRLRQRTPRMSTKASSVGCRKGTNPSLDMKTQDNVIDNTYTSASERQPPKSRLVAARQSSKARSKQKHQPAELGKISQKSAGSRLLLEVRSVQRISRMEARETGASDVFSQIMSDTGWIAVLQSP